MTEEEKIQAKEQVCTKKKKIRKFEKIDFKFFNFSLIKVVNCNSILIYLFILFIY